jgi:hypothetical protein
VAVSLSVGIDVTVSVGVDMSLSLGLRLDIDLFLHLGVFMNPYPDQNVEIMTNPVSYDVYTCSFLSA